MQTDIPSASRATRHWLVADIGGTNLRLALVNANDRVPSQIAQFRTADYQSIDKALTKYLAEMGIDRVHAICLAVAGPVIEQAVTLTNVPWSFSGKELATTFDCEVCYLLNDLEAVAYALPGLSSNELLTIGPSKPLDLSQTIAIAAPGTGLGASLLVPFGNQHYALTSEAGHIGFSPQTDIQRKILEAAAASHARVSYETLVSGEGIQNLYRAVSTLHGLAGNEIPSPAEIFRLAQNRSCDLATTTVDVVFEILGQFAGDLVLVSSAWGGVCLAGGILARYPELLQKSRFRQQFEAKGSHSHYLRSTPTLLISHPQPGLLGATQFLASRPT